MKLLRRVIVGLLLLIALLVAVPAVFAALGIPISLAWLRGPVGSMASTALAMDVSIGGDMRLVPGLSPTFEIQGVEIAEPGKPDGGDEARVGLARVQLSLPSLLEGNIHIQEITAEDIQVAVTLGKDGPVTEKAAEETEPEAATTPSETESDDDAPGLGFKQLGELALRRILVEVKDATTGKQHRFELTELTGAATADEPMTLTAHGAYQGQPFHLDMKGGSVRDLLLLSLDWPLDMSAEFSGVKMRLAPTRQADASSTAAKLDYTLAIEGKRFDTLDQVAGVSLPPLGPYAVEGRFSIRGEHYSISDFAVRVGESELDGTFELDMSGELPRADVRLRAETLRLDDFDVADWSPVTSDERPAEATQAEQARDRDGQEKVALLSPEALKRVSAHFSLIIESVLSEDQKLGGGVIELNLEDGRLVLDPFRIELPAGPAELTLIVDAATSEGIEGSQLLPEKVSAMLAGTSVDITRIPDEPGTDASAPGTPWDIRYRIHVKGESLDRFDKYAGVSLPPLGPYELRAEALVSETKYAIPALEIRIGESDLGGELTLDTSGKRPRFDVNLASKKFQLNDFVFEDWSPLQASADETVGEQAAREKEAGGQDDEAVPALLSPEVMHSLDALFSLEMAQVLSGKERLGGGKIKLALEDGRITLDPLRINLPAGPIDVHMVVDSTTGAGFEGSRLLPVSISGKVAGTSVTLTHVSDESEKGDEANRAWNVRYRMNIKGESLDRFDKFAGVLLPPLGPYELRTDINARETHYSLTGLDVRVGDSDLQGEMTLDTDGVRPRAEVRLTTDQLQLEDFIFEDWSPQQGAGEQDEKKPAAELNKEEVNAILTPEAMRRLDALLSVKVKQVLLGEESFGGGVLEANLKDGRLDIDPIRVETPGGSVAMKFGLEPTDRDLAAQIGLNIEKFDFGILARRTRPESDMGGLISLDVDIDSRAEQGRDLMRDANGHIKFGIWPQNVEADLFDLWAVNLLTAILPSVDQGPTSKVNCVVARYKLENGLLTQESLLMDTTNMQVGGQSEASFKTETVSVHLRPRAKKPEFFSVATPIEVKGSFSDFDVAPAPGAIAGSAVRFLTSIVTTPVQRLFRKNVPSEGEPACTIAFMGKIPMGR